MRSLRHTSALSAAGPLLAAGAALLAGACSLPLPQSAPAQATHSYVLEWRGSGDPRGSKVPG